MVQVGSFILEYPGTVVLLGLAGLAGYFWHCARKVGDGFDVE